MCCKSFLYCKNITILLIQIANFCNCFKGCKINAILRGFGCPGTICCGQDKTFLQLASSLKIAIYHTIYQWFTEDNNFRVLHAFRVVRKAYTIIGHIISWLYQEVAVELVLLHPHITLYYYGRTWQGSNNANKK